MSNKTGVTPRFSLIANSMLIFMGGLLLIMQLHGYMHDKFSDDFGFNKDGHLHHHQDLDEVTK